MRRRERYRHGERIEYTCLSFILYYFKMHISPRTCKADTLPFITYLEVLEVPEVLSTYYLEVPRGTNLLVVPRPNSRRTATYVQLY